MKPKTYIFALLAMFVSFNSIAGPIPPAGSSTAVLQRLKKLNVLSRVLYIAAHPDDENNCLNAYLSNELLSDVAYLSLTRGDGGQNLIGPEQQEELSILRTEESVSAHHIDGAKVFFTRARDFGFSKTAAETLKIWDKEKVLSDIVWIIRQYRPDVIITRFDPDVPEKHGHHIASAILAREAFEAAGDPLRFREQLANTKVWQAKRLLWNVYDQFTSKGSAGSVSNKDYLVVDAGKFNPLLGASYGEIAAESRMLHRSQGMGIAVQRGSNYEYFKHIEGDAAANSLFDGIDISWNRDNKKEIGVAIQHLVDHFDVSNPAATVPQLVNILRKLDLEKKSFWTEEKKLEITGIIKDILGLHFEVIASDDLLTPGEKLTVQTHVLNRSDLPVSLKKIGFLFAAKDTVLQTVLRNCSPEDFDLHLTVDPEIAFSQPFWLKQTATNGYYNIERQSELDQAGYHSNALNVFHFSIDGYDISYSTPLQFKYVSPEVGEQKKEVAIAPPVLVDISEPVYSFTSTQSKNIKVQLRSIVLGEKGVVKLNVPPGWRVTPLQQSFVTDKKGKVQDFFFSVSPPLKQGFGELTAEVVVGERVYNRGFRCVSYSHIADRYYFPETKAKLIKVDFKKTVSRIAYVKGVADKVDQCLTEAGFAVTLLSPDQLTISKLKSFDALVIGLRAYNVIPNLDDYKTVLLEYVRQGGNVVFFYNTCFDLPDKKIGLLPLEISDKRVTDENAEIRFIDPMHKVLNYPNKITSADFDGWVQDRGSFFPESWDDHYKPILTMHDTGEEDLRGALLVAKLGKGYLTYTSLSFFRQLPAGVPGAYRLLSNILSISK